MLACVAALLLAAFCAPAAAYDILGLRLSEGAEYTRAVIDLERPLEYKLFRLQNPDRIVLDLRDGSLADGFSIPRGTGVLKGVRAGRQGGNDTRVVFDLLQHARTRTFLLPPGDKAGHRLVVDIYPEGARAPGVVKRAKDVLASDKPRNVVVAIDAGHGGKDPGAVGASGMHEKTITLAVARELKKAIDRTPGMTAVLTRDSDVFIPLEQRYGMAREAKADLFISIHADAFINADARGSSVWVLSPRGASSEAARWLADRENRADLVGGVTLDDKDATLAAVLLDLSQGATMGASNAVAEHVLRSLRNIGPTHRNYVERANFMVLRSPDVPSILVETAFITTPTEEARLKDARHRAKLARAILDGVRDYFTDTPPPGTLFAQQAERKRSGAARYVVSRGDTLGGIAQAYGVSVSQLRKANRLAGETLRAGDVLQIPSG